MKAEGFSTLSFNPSKHTASIRRLKRPRVAYGSVARLRLHAGEVRFFCTQTDIKANPSDQSDTDQI